MRKLFITAVITMIGCTVHAQYKVGDPYIKDGVKAVVINVNEDGSHGLVWALGEYDQPKDKAEFKRRIKEGTQKSKEQSKYIKKIKKDREMHMLAICDKLTNNGKQNFEIIKNYFSEQGLDMLTIFPEFESVTKLGDDWFIPGDIELLILSDFIAAGAERKNYRHFGVGSISKKWADLNSTIQQNAEFRNCWINAAYKNYKKPTIIYENFKSSTWTKSDNGKTIRPHTLMWLTRKVGPVLWLEILDKNKLKISLTGAWQGATCAAISEF